MDIYEEWLDENNIHILPMHPRYTGRYNNNTDKINDQKLHQQVERQKAINQAGIKDIFIILNRINERITKNKWNRFNNKWETI